jgi:hypothetical protein
MPKLYRMTEGPYYVTQTILATEGRKYLEEGAVSVSELRDGPCQLQRIRVICLSCPRIAIVFASYELLTVYRAHCLMRIDGILGDGECRRLELVEFAAQTLGRQLQ